MSNFFQVQEETYFSNNISINKFSELMIKDLSSLKIIRELLIENNFSTTKVETLEHNAFNLLINQIELKKGNNTVEVGVIGSFSSGKSTFINSLFGKSICPMAVKPTTSSITKFYYGQKEKITLNDKEITSHEYNNRSQHLKGDTQNTQTHYIEYAYPFERLHSIVLYDTPGFNNNLNENDTAVTMKTLDSVDVIFFVVDISKGTIDMSSIERVRELKEKRMYCILNKSDLKSKQAIIKIKNEILSKKIFLEVIDYSASKVLELGAKDYFSEYIHTLESNLISKKETFTSKIQGVKKEIKSRLKTKTEYSLYLDNHEILIDDFYISAKNQKVRVENMLNKISESKQSTLRQKLKFDRHNYQRNSKTLIEQELNHLKNQNDLNQFEQFDKSVIEFKNELYKFEKDNIKSFYTEWNYSFKSSCIIQSVLDKEKSYWSTPYSKIFFDKNKFTNKIQKMDTLTYMKELIDKWIEYFKNNYNIYLTPIDFELEITEEALNWYSNFYNASSYTINNDDDDNESIYFEDKDEAREYLERFLNFEHKNNINTIDFLLEANQENFEKHKRNFHTQDAEENKSIRKLKEELNKFIKEKEEYVTSLQR